MIGHSFKNKAKAHPFYEKKQGVVIIREQLLLAHGQYLLITTDTMAVSSVALDDEIKLSVKVVGKAGISMPSASAAVVAEI